jgi:hypothetical protein
MNHSSFADFCHVWWCLGMDGRGSDRWSRQYTDRSGAKFAGSFHPQFLFTFAGAARNSVIVRVVLQGVREVEYGRDSMGISKVRLRVSEGVIHGG